jgi:hypothetical protein
MTATGVTVVSRMLVLPIIVREVGSLERVNALMALPVTSSRAVGIDQRSVA